MATPAAPLQTSIADAPDPDEVEALLTSGTPAPAQDDTPDPDQVADLIETEEVRGHIKAMAQDGCPLGDPIVATYLTTQAAAAKQKELEEQAAAGQDVTEERERFSRRYEKTV